MKEETIMRFLRSFLPHLALALALGVIVLVILDGFNPLMAFLTSRVSKIYILTACVCSVIASLIAITEMRK